MAEKIDSFKVGKYTDLALLEKILFDVQLDDIAKIKVAATMMDGKVVHEEAVDWSTPENFPAVLGVHTVHSLS